MSLRTLGALLAGAVLAGCKPSEVLDVPPPATQLGSGPPQNASDAETVYNGAATMFFQGLDGAFGTGLLGYVDVLSDEWRSGGGWVPTIDARYTSAAEPGHSELADGPLQLLYQARSTLLLAEAALAQYEPDSAQYKAGEALAFVGYIELAMAEDFCAGATLSYVPVGGGVKYGQPLTTDSLLGVAEAHFVSALTLAHGAASIQGLASVGLGRARLDRAHYAEAAAAVAAIPTSFIYNVELAGGSNAMAYAPDLYTDLLGLDPARNCPEINIADREGGVGLNFVSAHDPRLVLDPTLAEACFGQQDGLADSVFYYPTRFGEPPTGLIPLATGVEARLIQAEAALATSSVGTWAADLNALRASAPSTFLALSAPMNPLSPDSTTAAGSAMQIDVMFRERAFWLFGTGTRLGDMRRLVRSYHRAVSSIYATGSYPFNDPNFSLQLFKYGPDVSLTLPTSQSGVTVTNPYYRSCVNPPGTA